MNLMLFIELICLFHFLLPSQTYSFLGKFIYKRSVDIFFKPRLSIIYRVIFKQSRGLGLEGEEEEGIDTILHSSQI